MYFVQFDMKLCIYMYQVHICGYNICVCYDGYIQ